MQRRIIFFLLLILLAANLSVFAEEGMWPLSEIHKLNLAARGLQISLKEIYNPGKVSLIDAIVKVGRCTGSFVSSRGLILTNHHCAYRVAQTVSSAAKDYLTKGFLARNNAEELPAKGYRVRITESYRDVSREVLAAVRPGMGPLQRTKAIDKKIKEIIVRTERKHPGKRAQVAEMFIGKTYTLFIYTYLKDVRLVYLPPRSIGSFGGETDNWMWPRHNGDFAFMRAYVGPDGKPAGYSTKNIPYRPRKYLQVASRGVNQGDFVFILGYPGRTYRHRTSYFLAYEKDVRMPWVADLYSWQISVIKKMGRNDRDVAIRLYSRFKSLSNRMKNYRGKLQGMVRLALVTRKQNEEDILRQFINSDKRRRRKYGKLFPKFAAIYTATRRCAQQELVLGYLIRGVDMVSLGFTVHEASLELPKPDLSRKPAYMKRNFIRTKKRLLRMLHNHHAPTDRIFLRQMLLRAARLPVGQRIPAVTKLIGKANPEKAIAKFIKVVYRRSRLTRRKFLLAALGKSTKQLKQLRDPFIDFASALYPTYRKIERRRKRRRGVLARLHARLIDLKKQIQGTNFIPDANRTLRLTYGKIKGYSPADAVYCHPITTVGGIIEKHTGKPPFAAPRRLLQLHRARNFGTFMHPKLKDVPVCILYNTDTTGGNSGSPVLNARGELVGLNFDRAWEATINDYRWTKRYSRSIGVDIRYVLWVTCKFARATYLLREMKLK